MRRKPTTSRAKIDQQLAEPLSQLVEPLLTDSDLENLTGRARSTWQKARLKGDGPPFIRIGRLIRYRPSEVRAWLDAHTSLRSTSDEAA
jgi:predicted DNA-binding transcriptional regulator AlpA